MLISLTPSSVNCIAFCCTVPLGVLGNEAVPYRVFAEVVILVGGGKIVAILVGGGQIVAILVGGGQIVAILGRLPPKSGDLGS
eukprot:COSAG02_NODE_1140_length_14275_cov_154.904557_12_plen_83_part_00